MNLIKFKEQTIIIAENQPEYQPIPAFLFANDREGKVVCCWKLSWRDRLRLLVNGGKLWHMIMTFNQALQPQLLTLQKPFTVADHAAALKAKAHAEAVKAFVLAMGEKYGKKVIAKKLECDRRAYHPADRRRCIQFEPADFVRARELKVLFLMGTRIVDAGYNTAVPHDTVLED